VNKSYLTIASAGAVLGLDAQGVQLLIQDGKLEWAPWSGGHLYVEEEGVRALHAEQMAARRHPDDRRPASPKFPWMGPTQKAPHAQPARPAPMRTMAEMRAAGVVTAGDEAVAQAAAAAAPRPTGGDAVTAEQRAAIERLVAISVLKPADASAR
jgi:hypothetical protein